MVTVHSTLQCILCLSQGMDDADGAFISKTRFLQHWRDKPAMILEPYNIDTEENVLHFLARFDSKRIFTGAFTESV